MALIKKNELKQMGNEELKTKLISLRKELMKYNSQVATKTMPDNPGRINLIKKTIAKIYTKLNDKTTKVSDKTKAVKK